MDGKIVKVEVGERVMVTIECPTDKFAIMVAMMRNYDQVHIIGDGGGRKIPRELVVKEAK
jgi:hypothetical protein